MTQYVTKTDDTVDLITWKFYGFQDRRTVEQVLDANPGLADYGPSLPPGLVVELPKLATPVEQKGVKLWD